MAVVDVCGTEESNYLNASAFGGFYAGWAVFYDQDLGGGQSDGLQRELVHIGGGLGTLDVFGREDVPIERAAQFYFSEAKVHVAHASVGDHAFGDFKLTKQRGHPRNSAQRVPEFHHMVGVQHFEKIVGDCYPVLFFQNGYDVAFQEAGVALAVLALTHAKPRSLFEEAQHGAHGEDFGIHDGAVVVE